MTASPSRWPAYLRIPPFVPVPLRTRRDGWTAVRQGEFIGWLAETGSVAGAAARVGCSRESVYRLRRREGGAGFALAWDVAACPATFAGVDTASRKFTPDELAEAAISGVVHVVMRRGRYCGCRVEAHIPALLSLLARYDRITDEAGWEGAGSPDGGTQFSRLVSSLERRIGV